MDVVRHSSRRRKPDLRIPVIELALNTADVREAILTQNMQNIREALYRQPSYRTLTEAALEMSALMLVDFQDALAITQATLLQTASEGAKP